MPKKKTDNQYIQDFVDFLNQLLNATVTESRLILLEGDNPDTWVIARYQDQAIKPLELSEGFLHFRQLVRCDWRDDGKQHVVVEKSIYTFSYSENPDDEDDWIIRYEYSELSESPDKPHAHIHVNGKHPKYDNADYRHLHLPTERLSIEQFLMFLIAEMRVAAKDGAFEILKKSHLGFLERRTDIYNPQFP